MPPGSVRGLARALVFVAGAGLAPAPGGGAARAEEGALRPAPTATGPTGREIYQRVLDNRFRAYRQRTRLVSGDRAGNEQESRMLVVWKSFRDDAASEVLSKTVVRYTHPFDLRHAAYLVINRAGPGDLQWVYLPSRRRVQRVNLRGEAVLGSDFSFEDVVPRELEDARYERLADATLDGVACRVVEVTPRQDAESEYSRFRVWVDAGRDVVLRALYWDRAGVEAKELRSAPDAVRQLGGVHVPMRTSMRNLKLESYTHLFIEDIEPDPELAPHVFDPSRLEGH